MWRPSSVGPAEAALLDEKAGKLIGVAQVLDQFLGEGYDALLTRANVDPAAPAEVRLKTLNRLLCTMTNAIAASFGTIGVGYYDARLDQIVAYGPSERLGYLVGISPPPDHPGRIAMAEQVDKIAIGSMVRGDILNCMHPLIRNKKTIGFTFANESLDDIYRQIRSRGIAIVQFTPQPVKRPSGMLGESPAMQEVFHKIDRIARTDASVLILGETGTGKELAAQAIHRFSPRADGPFVAFNCAAVPENLLESELFGYARGAFTGADRRKPGRFELANGGTLLLDEVGDMPLPLQAKLLRVLETQAVEPLGDTKTVAVNVRVLASTHRDLQEMLRRGAFREDLYFRLAVVPLHLPPLRERSGDVPLLATHLLQSCAKKNGKEFHGFTPEAMASLQAYSWPGNVRELRNMVEQAVVLGDGGLVSLAQLPELAQHQPAEEAGYSLKQQVHQLKRGYEQDQIRAALRDSGGNRTQAARLLGISRRALQLKLKALADGSGTFGA